MPHVQMPDGAIVDLPDNPTPELRARVAVAIEQAKTAPVAPPPPSGMEQAWSAAKPYVHAAGRGIVSGVEGLAKLAAPALGTDWSSDLGTHVRTGAERVEGAVNEAIPNVPGEGNLYGKAAIEGGANALAMPIGGIGKNVISGVAAGIGGEGGEQLGGPVGRFLGTVLGAVGAGGATHLATRNSPNTVNLARQALEGVPPEKLDQASSLLKAAKAQGLDLDPAQALTAVGAPAANATKLRDMLLGSEHGAKTQAQAMNQPGQLSVVSDVHVAGLPGVVQDPQVAATNLAREAGNRVAQTQAEGARQVADTVARARKVLTDTADITVGQAQTKLLDSTDTLAKARRNLKALETKMTNLQGKADQGDLDAAQVLMDKIADAQKRSTKITGLEANQTAAQKAVADAKEARKAAQADSGPIALGDAKARQFQRDVMDPKLASPTGQIGRTYAPDKPGNIQPLISALEEGTSSAAPTSFVKKFGNDMSKTPEGQAAFADAVKTHLEGRIRAAFKPELAANEATNMSAAGKLNAVIGDERQFQSLKDALTIMAKNEGQNPADVVRGFEQFAQIVKGSANIKAAKGLSTTEAIDKAGTGMVSKGLKFITMDVGRYAGHKIQDFKAGRSLEKLDTIMTSTDGIKLLQQLGRTSEPWKARALITTYMQTQDDGQSAGITGQ